MHRALVLTFASLAAACSANDHGNPSVIHDTTGAVYGWRCDDRGCDIASVDGTPALPACGAGTFWGYFAGRFIAVCPATPVSGGGWGTSTELCRIVTCNASADCPQWQGKAYECRSGLCQQQSATGNAVDIADALELCLASTARAARCDPASTTSADPTIQQALAAVTASCSAPGNDGGAAQGPCVVPPSCRQP